MPPNRFTRQRGRNLTESMDTHLDEETKTRLLEFRKLACVQGDAINLSKACLVNLDKCLLRWKGGLAKERYKKRKTSFEWSVSGAFAIGTEENFI